MKDEQILNKGTEISDIECFSLVLNLKDSKKDIKQSISHQSLSTDHSQKVAMKKMFPYDVTNGKFKTSDVKECKDVYCDLKFYEFLHKNSGFLAESASNPPPFVCNNNLR